MQAINNAFAGLNASLTNILSNPYVSTALTVFALVFASLAAPNLPPFLASLFDSNLFKLFYLFLILVLLRYNVAVALIAALGFILAMQTLNRYRSYSYAQDRRAAAAAAAGGALSAAATGLGPAVGSAVDFVGRVGEATYNLGKDIVRAPGQVLSGVGNTLSNLPSSLSTVLVGDRIGQPSMIDVNTGCGVPTSCQNVCGGQPMSPTGLPDYVNDEVVGLCGCDSEGPQGLRFPPGYENLGMGHSVDF